MAHISNDYNPIKDVVSRTADLYGVSEADLVGKSRNRLASELRYFIYVYLHYDVGLSSNVIGRHFDRSRYNVLRGIRTLKGWMQYHPETKDKYHQYVSKLKGG